MRLAIVDGYILVQIDPKSVGNFSLWPVPRPLTLDLTLKGDLEVDRDVTVTVTVLTLTVIFRMRLAIVVRYILVQTDPKWVGNFSLWPFPVL